MVRRRGISYLEVALVAGAIAMLGGGMYGALRSMAGAVKVEQTKAILSQVRSAIRLHNYRKGSYPTTLTSYTYPYRATGTATGYMYGNMAGMPKDPFKGVTTVTNGTVVTGIGGWLYDSATGRLWVNLYDSEYGLTGSFQKLPENPSTW